MKSKGIYKRGSIYWISFAGPEGKIRQETSRSHRKKDAEALLIKRRNEVQEGRYTVAKSIRRYLFHELANKYNNFVKKQRSYSSKKYIIAKLKAQFRNIPLVKFNPALLEQFQTDKLNAGHKPATVNRYLATLKHMFSKAFEWEMIDDSVLAKVRKVKQLEENNRRLRYLTPEECKNLVNACCDYLKTIVEFALKRKEFANPFYHFLQEISGCGVDEDEAENGGQV